MNIKNKKAYMVNVRLSEKERDTLEEIAEHTGYSYSRIVRDSIEKYYKDLMKERSGR